MWETQPPKIVHKLGKRRIPLTNGIVIEKCLAFIVLRLFTEKKSLGALDNCLKTYVFIFQIRRLIIKFSSM